MRPITTVIFSPGNPSYGSCTIAPPSSSWISARHPRRLIILPINNFILYHPGPLSVVGLASRPPARLLFISRKYFRTQYTHYSIPQKQKSRGLSAADKYCCYCLFRVLTPWTTWAKKLSTFFLLRVSKVLKYIRLCHFWASRFAPRLTTIHRPTCKHSLHVPKVIHNRHYIDTRARGLPPVLITSINH